MEDAEAKRYLQPQPSRTKAHLFRDNHPEDQGKGEFTAEQIKEREERDQVLREHKHDLEFAFEDEDNSGPDV